MAISLPPNSLENFINVSQAATGSGILKVNRGNLSEASHLGAFFSTQASRRNTIDAFTGALRTEFGDDIANMLNKNTLDALRKEGKPLTARTVMDLVGMAYTQINQINARNARNAHNSEVVATFIRGDDAEKSLDKGMERLYARHGVTEPQYQVRLRDRVQKFLENKAARGTFHPEFLTADALLERFDAEPDSAALSNGLAPAVNMRGEGATVLRDRLRLADMGETIRTEAIRVRRKNALEVARPLLAMNDDADSFLGQLKTRAAGLVTNAELLAERWDTNSILVKIEEMAIASEVPLSDDEIRKSALAMREEMLNEFFGNLTQAAAELPEEQQGAFIRGCLALGEVPDIALMSDLTQAAVELPEKQQGAFIRDCRELGVVPDKALMPALTQAAAELPAEQQGAFIRGCLELGVVPDKALMPAMEQMTKSVTNVFEAISKAQDAKQVRRLFEGLIESMRLTTNLNPVIQDDSKDFRPAHLLAMRLGLQELMGKDDPQDFFIPLTRSGSPFRDMLYDLAHEAPTNNEAAAAARNYVEQGIDWLITGMSGILSDKTNSMLAPGSVREADLSLGRQREIFGPGRYLVRGLEEADPELAGLNEEIRRDMGLSLSHMRRGAERELLMGPNNNNGTQLDPRTDLGLSQMFMTDYVRGGIIVNGRYHHPRTTGTTEQGFIDLFPDLHTAGLISNVSSQSIVLMAMKALYIAHRKDDYAFDYDPDAINERLMNLVSLTGVGAYRWTIDTLDADRGLYRVGCNYVQCEPRDDRSIERQLVDYSLDLDLGAPSVEPELRPQPKITAVHLDFLARGRELVPDER